MQNGSFCPGPVLGLRTGLELELGPGPELLSLPPLLLGHVGQGAASIYSMSKATVEMELELHWRIMDREGQRW